MSQRVLVGGSRWLLDCLLGFAAATIIAGFVFAKRERIADGVAHGAYMVAAAIFALSLVVVLRRRLPLAWAIDLGDGLDLFDRRGVRTIRDDAIGAVSLVYEQSHKWDGEAVANRRRMKLQVAGEQGMHEYALDSEFPLGTLDPLQAFVSRVVARLTDTAHAVVRRGGTFPGDGWQLSAREIKLQLGGRTETWPVRDFTAADIYDKQLCLWRGNEELPAIRLPQTGWNNVVLLGLLRRMLAEQPKGHAAKSGAGLGRLLYERRESKAAVAFYYFITASFVVGLLATIYAWITNPEGETVAYASGVGCLTLLTVLGAIASHFSTRDFFRCHESGIFQRKHLRDQQLEFREIAAFTFRVVRSYHNDTYTGTTYDLFFEPATDASTRTIAYHKTMRKSDEMFDAICEHVAGVIGSRMAADVEQGKPTAWTDTTSFDGGRLMYRSSRSPDEQREKLLTEIGRFRLENGVLYLIAVGAEVAFLAIRSDERNFYPGFACLRHLVTAAHEQATDKPATDAMPEAVE